MSELKGSIRSANAEVSGAPQSLDPGDSPHQRQLGSRKRNRREQLQRRGQQTLAMLPTMLTLGNGVCGMAAIAVASSENLAWTPELKLMVAGFLIFGGMLFDALDGSAARMTGQTSEFGAQLDSLCDAITFGAAPAMVLWRFNTGDYVPLKLTWAIGVVFTLCVLIRLARFNAETDEDDPHDGFEGLPSPAAAGTIAAFAIGLYELAQFRTPETISLESGAGMVDAGTMDSTAIAENAGSSMIVWLADNAMVGFHYLLPALACALAFLMVSRLEYPHVFQQMVRGTWKPNQIGQFLFVGIVIFFVHSLAIPLLFCYYAFRAPLAALFANQKQESASLDS